jgi:hypothetical protein
MRMLCGMDDAEFAKLRQKLIDAILELDRADGKMRDLARAYRIEQDRRDAAAMESGEQATVTPIRPEGEDEIARRNILNGPFTLPPPGDDEDDE